MLSIWTDLRQALRSVAHSRSVAGLSILCLGLGIGVFTMVLAVINAVLLQPVPFRHPGGLLEIAATSAQSAGTRTPVSIDHFERWQRQPLVAELAAMRPVNIAIARGGDVQQYAGVAVTWNVVRVLGVDLIAGRGFRADEDRAGADVVLISETAWRSEFGADPSVLGGRLRVDGREATVIGIVPRFTHPGLPGAWRAANFWVPLASVARDEASLTVLARSPLGSDAEAVATALEAQLTGIDAADPIGRNRAVRVGRIDVSVSSTTRAMLLTATGAAVFVLLIACANVANLMLLRATARQREMATRIALGASRGRIARQLGMESAIVGLGAVPPGLLFGWLGHTWLLGGGIDSPFWIDARVVVAATATALLTSMVFGLAPLMQSMRASAREILGDGGRATPGRSQHRLRMTFVTAEVVLSVVLLVSASLLARSFANMIDVDRSLDLTRVAVVGLGAPAERNESPAETARVIADIEARVASLPTVSSTAVSEFMPLRGGGPRVGLRLEGVSASAPAPVARRSSVSARFFSVIGIAFDVGRAFTPAEERAREPVAVVNRRMADQLWPLQDAMGKRFRFEDDNAAIWYSVIGVSQNISNWDIGGRPLATAYVPLTQPPQGRRVLIVRTADDAGAALASVRDIVASFDRTPRTAEPVLLETVSRDAFFRQRSLAALFGVFSVLSVLLTAVGVYGVLAYFVSQRRRELGIRAALGATRRDLIRLVGRQTLLVGGGGIAIGLLAAFAVTRLLRSFLFEVGAADPFSFMATSVFLLAVTVVAGWRPARRAASIDPAVALRD